MKTFKLLFFVTVMIAFSGQVFSQSNGKIAGIITDSGTGHGLPGANVYLDQTNIGAATDLSGEYTILNVPPGEYTLIVNYIGYDEKSIPVEMGSDVLVLNIELSYQALEGETVIVTAQAEGQMQAINQQKTSNSVVNIVSSAKIQELPESNAAEAVGRLPGVSLQREGGEGNKVVIRGLSPQYNKVTINNVSMAATGDEDRSVDLSMISPNILDGIEVSKTAMADKEADHLGGSVNFVLRGAPDKTFLNAKVQGGYNGLRDDTGNYYYVLGGGSRFFDDKLGLLIQGTLEKTDRSSNTANAEYSIVNSPTTADTFNAVNNVNYQDISRLNERSGGVLVLDYKLPYTKIKVSNTINNLDITEFQRQENFNTMDKAHNWQSLYSEKSLFTLLNTLDVEQTISDYILTAGLNYSQSKTETPKEVEMRSYLNNDFDDNYVWNQRSVYPTDITKSKIQNNIAASKVDQFYERTRESLEEEISASLNVEKTFKTDFATINIKTGGLYKHKYKKYDIEQSEIPLGWQDMALSRLYLSQKFDLTDYDYANEDFPYAPFIENNYDAGDFKSGDGYVIKNTPEKDIMLDVYNEIKNLESVNGVATGKTVWFDYTDSHLDDYHGNEDYWSAYILPTITLANNKVTFIPGLRYENAVTEYTANRSTGAGKPTDPFIFFSHTSKQKNDYLLPMIHLKYQMYDWFDIRTSYTQTLARPNYNRLIPTWSAFGSDIDWNNVELKPAQSQNFDIYFSIYSAKVGLFGIGLFAKNIADFTFASTTFLADSSQIRPEWPETVGIGGSSRSYINNPFDSKLQGLEVEWQSNFWWLPGALKGLVTSINYTYITSETKYPKYVPVYERVPGPLPLQRLVGTDDQSYKDRLIDQPTHIINFTVGFDYSDFSVRGSMQRKSNVFVDNNFFPALRSTTEPITLWNLKVRQKLPVEGLEVYMNINNISKAIDRNSNTGTGWFTNRSYYGLSADLGISYLLN